jgi:ApbE family
VIGVANLQNRALCASAVNRRAWGNGLHHVLDARTGAPTTEVVATWVVASDAALADGLATALFFTGAHRLAETHRFAYVRMLADGPDLACLSDPLRPSDPGTRGRQEHRRGEPLQGGRFQRHPRRVQRRDPTDQGRSHNLTSTTTHPTRLEV